MIYSEYRGNKLLNNKTKTNKIISIAWPLSFVVLIATAVILSYYKLYIYVYLIAFLLGIDLFTVPVLYAIRANKMITPEGEEITFKELVRKVAERFK